MKLNIVAESFVPDFDRFDFEIIDFKKLRLNNWFVLIDFCLEDKI